MRKLLVVLMVLAFLVPVFVMAQEQDAEIVFVNQSGVYLRFYVDGVPSGACPSGDYAVTTASLGRHNLKAIANNGATASRQVNLGSDGTKWTITPPAK